MFEIVEGKGFFLKFANGWTVSVQFGRENYCDHYSSSAASRGYNGHSTTAEIAAWDKSGNWFKFDDGDEVRGYVSTDNVANFIHMISKF